MRIINVVVIKNNVVDSIDSFGVFEEQLSQDVVEEAEKLFIEKAKELGYKETDDNGEVDNEEILDNGYWYDQHDGNGSVCISWSDI